MYSHVRDNKVVVTGGPLVVQSWSFDDKMRESPELISNYRRSDEKCGVSSVSL